jgi:translation initiation factor IF-3
LVVQFRGREITHPETGRAILERIIRELADVTIILQMAQMEGNRMNMVLGPKPKRDMPKGAAIKPQGTPVAAMPRPVQAPHPAAIAAAAAKAATAAAAAAAAAAVASTAPVGDDEDEDYDDDDMTDDTTGLDDIEDPPAT